ncbi:DUF559 domain-containing protein, partial [Priestia megaterium]|uniref:DUF559 domain-containing protein n=1 Tax=Priestia megaterium TaxID=1404 RepID=UPI00300955F7
HGNIPKTNQEYWVPKLSRNKERDKAINEYYASIGWNILRVWQHELKNNFDETINTIQLFINEAKK